VALNSAEIMAWVACPRTLAAQVTFPSDSAVRTLMRDAVATGRAVGIVIGLLEADGTRRILSEGSSGVEGRPLDGHSVSEIGSITKVFTGTLLAEMVQRGEVRLDGTVDSLLPTAVRLPSRNGRRLTLLDLATHYAGLPLVPPNLTSADPADPYANYPEDSLSVFLARHTLAHSPGQRFEYSNLGVGLLGFALARRSGIGYDQLLDARILAPLGMRDTRVVLTPAMRARLAEPHGEFGDPVPSWNWTVLAGGGGLRSSAVDLLAFAAANLSVGNDPLSVGMRDAHVPRRPAPPEKSSGDAIPDSIGLGYRNYERSVQLDSSNTAGAAVLKRLRAAR
jgi:serine-type D-Ala-D-Ala carboxypeptidase/endopeptidase